MDLGLSWICENIQIKCLIKPCCACRPYTFIVSGNYPGTFNIIICQTFRNCDKIVCLGVIGVAAQGECTDLRGTIISSGLHYVPGPDTCTLCICDNGMPKVCKAVLCSPPQVSYFLYIIYCFKNKLYKIFAKP